jgi:hypothetical protein
MGRNPPFLNCFVDVDGELKQLQKKISGNNTIKLFTVVTNTDVM